MDSSWISGLVSGIAHQGYLLLFIGMLFEGPVITAGGSFGAAVGVFNPWIVLVLSVLGNLIPDAVYYALGYWGREKFINKYGPFFHITPARIEKLERLFHTHPGKTLLTVKMLPAVATPGLVIAGVTRMRIRLFAWWCVVITVPSSALYFIIGYYSGAAYTRIVHYIDYGGYVLLGIIVVAVGVIYASKKISARVASRMEAL